MSRGEWQEAYRLAWRTYYTRDPLGGGPVDPIDKPPACPPVAVIPDNPSRALEYPLDKHVYGERHPGGRQLRPSSIGDGLRDFLALDIAASPAASPVRRGGALRPLDRGKCPFAKT
jgi:hypothetical protein